MAPRVALLMSMALIVTGCVERGHKTQLQSVTSITLEYGRSHPVRVTVKDPAVIQEFVSSLRFDKKTPCACDHMERIVFNTPSGGLDASICHHCMDILKGEDWLEYAMPEALYKLYRANIEGHLPPTFGTEEQAAIDTLVAIIEAQASFQADDPDGDGVPDFAASLSELQEAGLIDAERAAGRSGAYEFTLTGGTSEWKCIARPVDEGSDLHLFITCTDAVIRFASKGETPDCTSPAARP